MAARPGTKKRIEASVRRRERFYEVRFLRQYRGVLATQRAVVLQRLQRMSPERIEALANGTLADFSLFRLGQWDRLRPPLRTLSRNAFADGVKDGYRFADAGSPPQARPSRRAAQISDRTFRLINRTTRRELRDTLAQGARDSESRALQRQLTQEDAIRIVGAYFAQRTAQMPGAVATVVHTIHEMGMLSAYARIPKVRRKRWNTQGDNKVRGTHAATNGQIRNVGTPFKLGDGEAADAPGVGARGSSLSVGNAANCRCFVTPVLSRRRR